MFYPEFKFIDITRSITNCADVKTALEENKLTVAIQPAVSGDSPFSALIGPCLVCDVSNAEGPITQSEVHETAGKLIAQWLEGFEKSIELSGFNVTPPPPPSRILFKTVAVGKQSQGRVFDKDVVDLIVDDMKLELVGTDHNRLGDGAQHDEILDRFEQSNITVLLNLNLQEIAHGVEGKLIATPLKITGTKQAPARTVIMQR